MPYCLINAVKSRRRPCCGAENQVLQIVLKDHDRVLGDTEIGRWANPAMYAAWDGRHWGVNGQTSIALAGLRPIMHEQECQQCHGTIRSDN